MPFEIAPIDRFDMMLSPPAFSKLQPHLGVPLNIEEYDEKLNIKYIKGKNAKDAKDLGTQVSRAKPVAVGYTV